MARRIFAFGCQPAKWRNSSNPISDRGDPAKHKSLSSITGRHRFPFRWALRRLTRHFSFTTSRNTTMR